MLNILYRTVTSTFHCKALVYEVGMVVTFSGNREVDICDDIKIPIGFLMESSNESFVQVYRKEIKASVVNILTGNAEFQTDIVEQSTYKIGDFLYCSRNGKLTNEAEYRGNIIIGIVNSVEETDEGRPCIGLTTCFARGLERPALKKKETFSRYRILKNENK